MSQELISRITQSLGRQEQQLSFAITLMEHLVVPTFVLDAEQKVLIWNRACERLTDMPAAEVLGTRNHWQAFYEEPRPCLADLVATSALEQMGKLYAAAGDPREPALGVHAENWCWMPRRRQNLYLAIDAGPVFDESGKLIAVVETLRDITESHVAQIQVQEQANQLKAHFDEQQREAELARRILDHQIRTDLMAEAGVEYSVIPASNFSGDMVLAARSPSGRLYAILADATESVFAAVYLDGGVDAARDLIHRVLLDKEQEEQVEERRRDYKTELQELVQRKPDQTLRYEMTGSAGPDHARLFAFRVTLNGEPIGAGEGRSKKEAEQSAARSALKKLQK